jgi:hypothetical protein
MDAILNINSNAAAFGDQNLSNNPKRRYFDWTRNANGLRVRNPKANSITLYPGETKTVFDGVRVLTADATTTWASKSMGNNVYRFSWTGGAAPGMRTQRSLAFAATNIVVTINNNSTVTFTAAGLFANVQAQDNIYISLPTDPNPSLFNPANTGFWTVLSASPNAITLARPVGQSFNAAAETVSVTNTAQGPILAYSATGVQVGDTVDISGGFQTSAQKSYTVAAVSSNWFEVMSVSPLAEETGIAPNAALKFYANAKAFLRVETDQDVLVYLNGSSSGIRIIPVVAADPANMGWFENYGAIWSLSVYNRSAYDANCNTFSAE